MKDVECIADWMTTSVFGSPATIHPFVISVGFHVRGSSSATAASDLHSCVEQRAAVRLGTHADGSFASQSDQC
jgi:hypothetical protein